jgi:hypothetical protein
VQKEKGEPAVRAQMDIYTLIKKQQEEIKKKFD